eukprot:1311126-Rhodomonas_salina.2
MKYWYGGPQTWLYQNACMTVLSRAYDTTLHAHRIVRTREDRGTDTCVWWCQDRACKGAIDLDLRI